MTTKVKMMMMMMMNCFCGMADKKKRLVYFQPEPLSVTIVTTSTWQKSEFNKFSEIFGDVSGKYCFNLS